MTKRHALLLRTDEKYYQILLQPRLRSISSTAEFVPEIAPRRHAESISGVVKEALEKADCTMDDIEAIAVTYAPGLIGALLVGVNFAKGLSFATRHSACARSSFERSYCIELHFKRC